MTKTFTMDLAGRTLRVDVGRVAAQANGAAFIQYGETTVLSTVCTCSQNPLKHPFRRHTLLPQTEYP